MKNYYNLLGRNKPFLMKSFFTFFLVLTACQNISAQVTIPTANTNTANNRKPFGSFYGFERTAAIYTLAEHGMSSGSTVTSICFYVNAVTTPDNVPVNIYMSSTSASTFTASTFASEIAGATTVYSGTITGASLVAGSWSCITLTTPFTYTGNNLKVMVEANYGGAGNEGSSAKQFRWSSGASQTWQADNTAPAGNGTVSSVSRPNVQLSFTPPGAIGTLEFSSATYAGNEGSSVIITVNRVGGQTGIVSVDYATSNGSANSGLDYTAAVGTLTWANNDFAPKTFTIPLFTDLIADPAETVNLILSNPTGTTITGTNPTVLTITDAPPPLTGVYTVGTAGNYTSLTNAGGIFAALNLSGASGNIAIDIISDLTAETGTFALNEIAGGFTTLIQPTGIARTITGSSTSGLIKLNGADGVTINGALGSGSTRDLSILNTNVGTSSGVVWNASASASNGANNNTIRNTNVSGNAPLTTFFGIFSGSGTTIGGVAETANNNFIVENNSVIKSQFGIAVAGATAGNTGNRISQNTVGSIVPADYIGFIGMFFSNNNGVIVNKNTISNIITSAANPIGINIAANVINSTFDSNAISEIAYTGTFGYGGKGMNINTATATSNLTISNNMISGIRGDGWNDLLGDSTVGIRIGATAAGTVITGGIKLYNNSVNLGSGTFAGNGTGTQSATLYLSSTTSNLDIQNNIFVTNLQNSAAALAKTWAINSAAANTAFTVINNNDYSTGGTQGFIGFIGSDRATLADIQTGFGQNVASVNISPVFVSATDLHLNTVSNPTLDNLGTPVAGITLDFDGNARSATTPDMGADEFTSLSVNKFDLVNGFNAYPNPVSSVLNIEYTSDLTSVKIFNMLGQQVLVKNVSATSTQIDMSALTNGTYLVKVEAGSVSKTIKVFKK